MIVRRAGIFECRGRQRISMPPEGSRADALFDIESAREARKNGSAIFIGFDRERGGEDR